MKDIKFCKNCKKVVIAEMEKAGYLQKVYFGHSFRPEEAKEDTYITKHGSGHG